MNNYIHFTEKEFNSLTPSCSLSDMSPAFMEKLDKARHFACVPFVLNCAYRSVEWDKSKGRNGLSYHCSGRAVDVRCKDSMTRFRIMNACLHFGLSVGIYGNFLHIDNRICPVVFLVIKKLISYVYAKF